MTNTPFTSPSPPPGRVGGPLLLAGRYELSGLVGRGGMADVYRATDLTLERAVAVKLLRESAGSDVERQRFMSEARTLAGLSHTGLVTLLDAGFGTDSAAHRLPGEEQTQPFLVMELVDGVTLARRIDQGPMPLEEVSALGVQLAEALAYVHAHGIIHRDIKPGNVLLGVEHRVKLADFGIARLLEGGPSHTLTGQAIGTAAYLAPEQVTGSDLGAAIDIYSLGLVLLEALTGRREYPGPPTEAAVARLNRQPLLPEDLPEAWRRLLQRMTALDPADRPDAAAVAATLRAEPTSPIPSTGPTAPDPATVPLLTTPPTAVHPGRSTAVMNEAPAQHVAVSGERAPAIDRAGDAMARGVVRAVDAVKRLPRSRQALLVLAGMVVLLVAVLIISTSGEDSSDIPENTPTQLREPLQRLHDAVKGEQ